MVQRRGCSVAAVLVTRLVADHHRSTAVAIHASLARRSQLLATAAPHHRPQLSCQPTNTHTQWRRQGEGAKLPPMGGRPKIM